MGASEAHFSAANAVKTRRRVPSSNLGWGKKFFEKKKIFPKVVEMNWRMAHAKLGPRSFWLARWSALGL